MSDNFPENVRIDLGNNSVAWSPCTIGVNLAVGSNSSIGSLAHIGRNVVIGDECRIQGGAYIADGCILGNQVFVGPNATLLNDRYPPSGNKALWQPINVNDGAVIGGGATVVAGCDIGKNAVLAAGAVLTKHLPGGEVWAGNPARFMMKRSQYESKR
jgi:acetyltransferase-like isoleucine patch superfamily enzyme